MPKKSSPKSSPKPKSVKRRVVKKPNKSNKSIREIEKQRLIDGAKVCVRAVDGRTATRNGQRMRVDSAASLLSNHSAAELFGVEKERKQLQEHLSELAIIAERLLVKIGEKPTPRRTQFGTTNKKSTNFHHKLIHPALKRV